MGTNASVLLLYKKKGITSFAALSKVKRLVDPKVGHAGTLDKFAEGLLVVMTGSMTRLNPLFSNLGKEYEAWIRFGMETSTLDPEGTIIATGSVPTLDAIKEAIDSRFLGTIMQAPPLYSAIHIDGVRASKRARDGQQITMDERPVTIHSFEVLDYADSILHCTLSVSKGTYIRSIARDLAIAVGSKGYLAALKRNAIGPYRVEEALEEKNEEAIIRSISQTSDLLLRLPQVGRFSVPQEDWKMMDNGKTSKGLLPMDGKEGTTIALAYALDTFRWVVDLKSGKILCQLGRGND